MKVKDIIKGTPYYCQPGTNLGSATELMWNANCGFLPVESAEGKVIGVITDRDICIALETRNRRAGEVTVAEVLTGKLYSCAPDGVANTEGSSSTAAPSGIGERNASRRSLDGRHFIPSRTQESWKGT
jgi:predicted transcriptional regulator